MVQEGERSANTLATFDESTSILWKAEGEYQGHHSLLMRTCGFLSAMQRQVVFNRYLQLSLEPCSVEINGGFRLETPLCSVKTSFMATRSPDAGSSF
ncbi:hypothetical protein GUJ93_ZPchr0006g46200 [Zizania palustris]|uniref:Sec20 C-terminal domain-containing protein n=1 Tax=Zizania palustris TaxID=103762 RepID=A0A8J5TCI6_ZIZPA|nr:hypothetical protein GUJ93_ZPchr0006g46200 [Zizania palustris]